MKNKIFITFLFEIIKDCFNDQWAYSNGFECKYLCLTLIYIAPHSARNVVK